MPPLPCICSLQLRTPPSTIDAAHERIIFPDLYASLTNITEHLPNNFHTALLHYVNIYIGDFIAIVQGGPTYWQRIRKHVF